MFNSYLVNRWSYCKFNQINIILDSHLINTYDPLSCKLYWPWDIFILPQILLCCWQRKIKEREGLENNITMSQGWVVLKLIHLMLGKRKKCHNPTTNCFLAENLGKRPFFFLFLFLNQIWYVKRPKLFGLTLLRCV